MSSLPRRHFLKTAALSALAIFILLTLVTRYVSLASMIASASMPLFLMIFEPTRSPIFVASGIFLALVIIIKHRANIARLKAGTESRLGSKPQSGSPSAEAADPEEIA